MGMKFLASFVLLAALSTGCGSDGGTPTAPSANVPFSTTDLRVGTGAEAILGRPALVNYTGWLYSTTAPDNKGTRFDSSLDPGRQPYPISSLGSGVIQGFSMGIQGMRVGGLRRVVIPPSLGYGSQAQQGIPANSTLLFEIELLAVQ